MTAIPHALSDVFLVSSRTADAVQDALRSRGAFDPGPPLAERLSSTHEVLRDSARRLTDDASQLDDDGARLARALADRFTIWGDHFERAAARGSIDSNRSYHLLDDALFLRYDVTMGGLNVEENATRANVIVRSLAHDIEEGTRLTTPASTGMGDGTKMALTGVGTLAALGAAGYGFSRIDPS